MHVAIVTHCYYPDHYHGTEAYARSVAHELKGRGCEVTILSAILPGEATPHEGPVVQYTHEGIHVVAVNRNRIPNVDVRSLFYLPALRLVHERVLRLINPDIVHVVHLANHTTSIVEVATKLGLPLVATFTDFFGICFNGQLLTASRELCGGPNPTRSNCVHCFLAVNARTAGFLGKGPVAPLIAKVVGRQPRLAGASRSDVEAVIERPGFLEASYGAIGAAIAPTRYLHDLYRRNGFKRPLNLSHFGIDIDRAAKPARSRDAPLRFGYIGQLAVHKGVHLLLHALQRLHVGQSQLEVWGDPTQDRAYAKKLLHLAEGLDVTFRGTFHVSRIARILREVDVLVIPSLWSENSPLILLQALATHTPVIVSNVEGLTEFTDAATSLQFTRGDDLDLFVQMRKFLDQPELAAAMSQTTSYGRTIAHMVDDVVAMYEHQLKSVGRPLTGSM